MMDQNINVETKGDNSPGVVHGNVQITQIIVKQYNDSKRKRWKKIDEFFLPIITDSKKQKGIYAFNLALLLHHVFKNSGYVNFTSLFTLASKQYKGKTFSGYYLLSHQSKYIGALKLHLKNDLQIKMLATDKTEHPESLKKYEDLLTEETKDLIDNWKLDVNFSLSDTIYTPLEFIYHPDIKRIRIGSPSIISSDPADYPEKVKTTSEFLTFFSMFPNLDVTLWKDYECISSYYPLEKFCIVILDGETISTDNIRLNVENCEEYDYINNDFDIEVKKYS